MQLEDLVKNRALGHEEKKRDIKNMWEVGSNCCEGGGFKDSFEEV